MLNITLNDINNLKTCSLSKQRWSQSVRNKKDFIQILLHVKLLFTLLKVIKV